MDIDYFRLLMSEQHLLMMRIVKILEYSNIQDLKTINSFLTENGFVTKEDLSDERKKQ